MKTIMTAIGLWALAVTAAAAATPVTTAAPAQGRAVSRSGLFGLGVELGEQNGGTAKLWLSDDQAVSGGLGITSNGDLGVHAEYSWTAWRLLPQPPKGELGIHAAMGLRLRDDEFGLRPTAGLDYWLPGHPVELFIDAGPVFRLSPDEGVDTTAMLGVRFYLAQEKSK